MLIERVSKIIDGKLKVSSRDNCFLPYVDSYCRMPAFIIAQIEYQFTVDREETGQVRLNVS